MTILRFSGGFRRWLPATPAFGLAEPLEQRVSTARLAIVAGMLVLALLVRVTGALSPAAADLFLPQVPGVHTVTPWLVRGGQPQETDLIRLRDDYRVGAVIDVDGTDIEEQAVARGLGLRMLDLPIADGQSPSADQIRTLIGFLRSAPGRAADGGGNGVVYVHDTTGRGPVLVVTAVIQLLQGVPLAAVLQQFSPEELAGLSAEQQAALQQIAAMVPIGAIPTGPYVALQGVIR